MMTARMPISMPNPTPNERQRLFPAGRIAYEKIWRCFPRCPDCMSTFPAGPCRHFWRVQYFSTRSTGRVNSTNVPAWNLVALRCTPNSVCRLPRWDTSKVRKIIPPLGRAERPALVSTRNIGQSCACWKWDFHPISPDSGKNPTWPSPSSQQEKSRHGLPPYRPLKN